MSTQSDYLWDRSGEPDAEVLRLEGLLRGAQFDRRTLDASSLPEPQESGEPQPHAAIAWRPRRGFAAAAALLLAVVGAWLGRGATADWGLERLHDGSIRAEHLPVGRWLETDTASRALLQVSDIGRVTVEPGSRVRIRESSGSRRLLELARGKIDAVIFAPPRLFVVDAPGVRAVDLGCAYTLEVDERGAGLLHVTMGFVELQRDGLTSTIPRGAQCATRANHGPGVPYFTDADAPFIDFVRTMDAGYVDGKRLDVALASARERDALTLWHILPRVNRDIREAVCDRLNELLPLPSGVSRDAVMRLDPEALQAWWRALSF